MVVIGLENVLVLTKSVVSTPVDLEVKLRIAQGEILLWRLQRGKTGESQGLGRGNGLIQVCEGNKVSSTAFGFEFQEYNAVIVGTAFWDC